MSVAFQRYESHSEFRERLKDTLQPAVLLGEEDEATREFFLGTTDSCCIGICSQGLGIPPNTLLDASRNELWVGYNSRIAHIDLKKCRLRFVVTLGWVFYAILDQLIDGSVIVVYELGICRINRDGKTVWNFTTDVVTDFTDAGDHVRLYTDDGEFLLDKESGRTVVP